VDDDKSWLSCSPTSGSSTGSGDKDTIDVTYNSTALAPGPHVGTITIRSPGATNNPQTIVVTLRVDGISPPDVTPPGVTITYPNAGTTLTDPLIMVTGTASDESRIGAIWVNGVMATSTGMNYSTWQAQIPLPEGWTSSDPNSHVAITAAAVDEYGCYDPAADTVSVKSCGERGLILAGAGQEQYSGCLVQGDTDTFQFEALEVVQGMGAGHNRAPFPAELSNSPSGRWIGQQTVPERTPNG
jgi:hypothetical protein